MGKLRPLPGRMTKLDVPQSIIMDVNRIGDDFDIVSIVTNEIREDRADKGLHTAAGGGETRQISATQESGGTEGSCSPYLDTITMGISWDLQYRKNSLKPESSLISEWCHSNRRRSCDERKGVLSLSTVLHSSNVCPFLLTLSNISRKASLHEREWVRIARSSSHMHTGMLRDQRGYLDYHLASSPCHSRESLSCLSFDRIKYSGKQTTQGSQSFES